MRAVVQRVLEARVEVGDEIVGAIGPGLLAYVGFGRSDTPRDRTWTVSKIASLRIFEHQGKMARALDDIGGSLLVVSQFTLYADVRRGRRPSFDDAMPPEQARVAYDAFIAEARGILGARVATGRFGAAMLVRSVNDGPVTIWLDSGALYRGGPDV
ncbi:MAG TPA: D-aminoacyl-tRNA deacylase [Polyangiaceae bacterium]|nr:D-aminoacyl-tRNA deacylase [Polyangiaceae bacterium]